MTERQVVYTEGDSAMIRVSAEVVHPESCNRDLTNVFFFTFKTHGDAPEVIPRSYAGNRASRFSTVSSIFTPFLRFLSVVYVEFRGHALFGRATSVPRNCNEHLQSLES